MKSFNFTDVTLKDGMLKDTLWTMINFYRDISFDSMFKYLRQDAGLDAPGEDFTGWYVEGRGVANIAQWISAMCRIYAITSEQCDYDRSLAMIEEFWKLHGLLKDTDKPVFTPTSFYPLEKHLMALIDCKEYLGIDMRQHAEEIVEFARTKLEGRRMFGDNGTEWYTIGESFYRAAEVFEIPEAQLVARKFEYRQFWDLFYYHKDPYSCRPKAGLYSEFCHAYSHVNSFNSCAMAYRKTGDRYYLDALCSFYDFMQNEQVMCTGGYGAEYEHIMPKENIIRALRRGHDSFETQCDTYAAYRIVRQMTELTEGARYSDWAERLIYNATVATIPMTKEGKVIYYSDYNMDFACKKNREHNWTCCTGTRPLLVCEMERLLYFHDEDSLYVAQYTPSKVKWSLREKQIELEQDTEFPVKDDVRITLHMEEDAEFSLYLRRPMWMTEAVTVRVNGTLIYVYPDDRGWIRITRGWSDGDVLEITIPQPLWMDALDKDRNAPNAFLRGPVVLAAAYDHGRQPIPPVEVRSFLDHFVPVEGAPLHYDLDNHPDIHFKPFYEFVELEPYSLYFDTGVHATETIPIY